MWFVAKGIEGIKSIKTEWPAIRRNSYNQEMREVQTKASVTYQSQSYSTPQRQQPTSSAFNPSVYGMKPASQISRPSPKPVRQGSFVPPEPTYVPLSKNILEDD
jgi:hypothetical protein